jgi:hypothetical protein
MTTDGEDKVQGEELPQPGRMLEREQQAGYVIALIIVGLAGAIGGSKIGQHNKTNYALFTGLAVVGAAAIAIAARRGRRLLTAFASVIAGLGLSVFGPLSYICLIYAGYLMFRHSQAQKKLNQLRPRQPRQPRTARSRRADKAASGTPANPSGRRPTANRRYTPPKAKTRRH